LASGRGSLIYVKNSTHAKEGWRWQQNLRLNRNWQDIFKKTNDTRMYHRSQNNGNYHRIVPTSKQLRATTKIEEVRRQVLEW